MVFLSLVESLVGINFLDIYNGACELLKLAFFVLVG